MRNGVEIGTKPFGPDQADSPDWQLENLGGGRSTVWTSPRIVFPQKFASKPAVSVTLAGIESAANVDTDRLGFSVEAADIDAAGFRVVIRRTQGILHGVTVNWLASVANKP